MAGAETDRSGDASPKVLNLIPRFFLVLAVPLLLAYVLVVPPFQAPDEDRHFWRAYSIADGHFVAQRETDVPASALRLHERFPPHLEDDPQKRLVPPAELRAWLRQPLEHHATAGIENPAANLYSFVPYTVVAPVLRVGRAYDVPALALLFAGRLANAAAYAGLMWLALQLLPEFRLLLAMVALTPMSLHMAASFSGDCLTLGLTAVYMALVFRLALDEKSKRLRPRDALLLALLLVLVSLCKFNLWLGLLILLIPSVRAGSRGKLAALTAACVLAALVAALGWQHINSEALAAFQAARAANGRVLADNAAFLRHHPLKFLEIAAYTAVVFSWVWLQQFVGMFGWISIDLNPLLVVLYAACIVVAVGAQPQRFAWERRQKLLLAAFALLSFVSLEVVLWIFETERTRLRQAYAGPVFIRGIAGRYFLPIALPALAAVSRRRWRPVPRLQACLLGAAAVVNCLALVRIWGVYH